MKKSRIKHALIALITAALSLANLTVAAALPATRPLPIYCVQRDDKAVSISFDAAWGNEDTQKLIDILAQYHVKTTFFVVGFWATKFPESVKALHDAGHEVMNHSDNHAHFNALGSDQIVQNISACNEKVAAVTGVKPTLIRLPYGEYNDNVITTVNSMGMYPIQWDVDSLDWKDLSAGEITQRVVSRVKPGSIVLFHNAAKHTPEALPAILESLQGQGYSVIPISQLLLKGDYTLDHHRSPAAEKPDLLSFFCASASVIYPTEAVELFMRRTVRNR